MDIKLIGAFVEDRDVIQYYLKTNVDDPSKYVECGTLRSSTPLYVAISPHAVNCDELCQLLSDGITDLQSSGDLKTIMTKYGITTADDTAKAKDN